MKTHEEVLLWWWAWGRHCHESSNKSWMCIRKHHRKIQTRKKKSEPTRTKGNLCLSLTASSLDSENDLQKRMSTLHSCIPSGLGYGICTRSTWVNKWASQSVRVYVSYSSFSSPQWSSEDNNCCFSIAFKFFAALSNLVHTVRECWET